MNCPPEIDYRRHGIWNELSTKFLSGFDPRPSRRCGRVECEPGWRWAFRLGDYDLWFAVSGTGTLCVNEEERTIRPGTLFFLRPDDTGWAAQDPNDRLTVIFLHLDFYVPGSDETVNPGSAWLPSRHVYFEESSVIDRLLTRTVRAVQGVHPASAVEARSLLHLSMLEIYRQDALNHGVTVRKLDPRIEELVQLLKSRPSIRLTVGQAAERVGLSPDYFSRLFRSETGESFRSYVLRVRMERARFLLEETAMKVGEIAESLGYREVYLFSRQFRETFGYPPSDVRKRFYTY